MVYYYPLVCLLAILVPSILRAQPSACCANIATYNSQTLLNTYYPPQDNQWVAAGSTSIVLDAVPSVDIFGNSYGDTPIQAGDLLLIIQMQGATFNSSNSNLYGAGNAASGPDGLGATGYVDLVHTGLYEYVIAQNHVPLSGGILQLYGECQGGGIVHTYENFPATATAVMRSFQVIRVPQFQQLTLNNNIITTAWNGRVGGLIALEVSGNLNLNGYSIDAGGRGFRGGYQEVRPSGDNHNIVTSPDINISSGKGEGICGTPRYMWNGVNPVDYGSGWPGYLGGNYGRGAPGNAGGGGNTHNAGGGGGGNGGAGGTGGNGFITGASSPLFPNGGRPGNAIPYSDSRLFLGGGGGGGDANNATSGVRGGPGGGIIILHAAQVNGPGQIRSNGRNGEPGNLGAAPDGAGGGGAGGTIVIATRQPSANTDISITANGGNGGNSLDNNLPHGPGGGGGGGLVMHNFTVPPPNIQVQRGLHGRTNNGTGIPYGAIAGQPGIVIDYGLGSQIPVLIAEHYPNPIAAFQTANICLGEILPISNESSVNPIFNSDIVSYQWSFGDGNTSSDEHPMHVYAAPGEYTVTLIVSTNWACLDSISIQVIVAAPDVPLFTPISPIFSGASFQLPGSSLNGITGSWSPAPNNTATTTYTFTPAPGQCAQPTTMTIVVQPLPSISIQSSPTLCFDSDCTPIAPLITVTGGDELIGGASVYFTANYVAGTDFLSFSPAPGITGSFNPITGVLSLEGEATISSYAAVLQTVCYTHTADIDTPQSKPVQIVLGNLLYNPDNNHFYRLVTTNDPINWSEAVENARESRYFGLEGYLVTITSQQEDDFINSLINSNSWLGASDAAEEGQWRWVTGCEGLEDEGRGRLFTLQQPNAVGLAVNNQYTNWACVEPNNCCGGEHYLHMIGPDNTILCGNSGEWNDYPDNAMPTATAPPVLNYIIEYGCNHGLLYDQLRSEVIIRLLPNTLPVFTQLAPICAGTALPPLPTIANNGIQGSWSPALNNTQTTTYTFTPAPGQCAAPGTMTIVVKPGSLTLSSPTACDEYLFYGESLTQSGQYQRVFQNRQGCDSIIAIQLTINPSRASNIAITACDSIRLHGAYVSTSGTYTRTWPTVYGCDSVVTVNLRIDTTVLRSTVASAIALYTWPVNNTIYTLSGRYEQRYVAANGCDSLEILDLQINAPEKIWLPNVFRPQSDGFNSVFQVFSSPGVTNIERLLIFDRWGALVFRQENFPPNDPQYGWDGTHLGRPLNPGVLVYQVVWVNSFGNTVSQSGDITLMR